MKTFKIILKLAIFATFILSYNVACKSKSQESSPDQVNSQGLTLQERLAQKAEIDKQIVDVSQSISQLKNVIKKFKQLKNAQENDQLYTPLDFLLDINDALKKKVPENKKDKKIRYADFTLPEGFVAENCRTVSTSLESEEELDDSGAFVSEKAIYSVKSCTTGENFLPVAEASWIGKQVRIKFNNANFDSSVGQIPHSLSLPDSKCKAEKDDDQNIYKIECRDIEVATSSAEKAKFTDITFYPSKKHRPAGNILESHAVIYEHGNAKADILFEIANDGHVNFQIDKAHSLGSEGALKAIGPEINVLGSAPNTSGNLTDKVKDSSKAAQ
jgi:hypothetical protein